MDYDRPYRAQGNWRASVSTLLIIAAGCALLWVGIAAIAFARNWFTSKSLPAVVVGYEMAGGSEQLRIQLVENGRRRGFMLVDASDAWPRYAGDQPIEVLTQMRTNDFGQLYEHTMVYSPLNHWSKFIIITLGSGIVGTIGVMGTAAERKRRKNG